MAWTSPRTYVVGEILTAAILNTHVRDNLLETAPAKVTTAGDLTYATGANALARLAVGSAGQQLRSSGSAPSWASATAGTADVATSQSTTSTAYTDLATAGPSVTLSPGWSASHLILIGAYMDIDPSGANSAFMSVAIAGAAAADADAARTEDPSKCVGTRQVLATGVANGATHTSKYRVSGDTGTFVNRRIVAVAL